MSDRNPIFLSFCKVVHPFFLGFYYFSLPLSLFLLSAILRLICFAQLHLSFSFFPHISCLLTIHWDVLDVKYWRVSDQRGHEHDVAVNRFSHCRIVSILKLLALSFWSLHTMLSALNHNFHSLLLHHNDGFTIIHVCTL